MCDFTRRRVLQAGAVGGLLATGGCLGVVTGSRDVANRQVPPGGTPPEGTWPTDGFDARGRNHNPNASPPRSSPTEDWTRSTGESPAFVITPRYVVVSDRTETVALSREGSVQWRSDPGRVLTYVDGRVYVQRFTEGASPLVALDAADGRVVWRSDVAVQDVTDCHEARGTVYVTAYPSVYGFHADSGTTRWEYRHEEAETRTAIGSERAFIANSEGIVALELGGTTGGLVGGSVPIVEEWSGTQMDGDLVVGNGQVFVSEYDEIERYDLRKSESVWQLTPMDLQYAANGTVLSATDDSIFATRFAFRDGDRPTGVVMALDPQTGRRRWRREGAALQGQVVGGDVLLAGTTAVGPPDNCIRTDRESSARCPEPTDDRGILYAFDAGSGDVLWTVRPDAAFSTDSIAAVGERIYYVDGRGLHALS